MTREEASAQAKKLAFMLYVTVEHYDVAVDADERGFAWIVTMKKRERRGVDSDITIYVKRDTCDTLLTWGNQR